MISINEIDGIPGHANKWLLTDLLRNEWHFQGYVVSDYGGVVQLNGFHHLTSNNTNAGKLALLSGVDMELDNPYCFSTLLESVAGSAELQAALDQAVRRILCVKFKLGLFDDPYVDPKLAEKVNHSAENIALSLKAAGEAIVLLKNQNHILPLDKSRYKKIAVIGPHANHIHYCGYAHKDTKNGIIFLEGIKKIVTKGTKMLCAEGCRIHEGTGHWLGGLDDFRLSDSSENIKRIEKAVQVAKKCEIVILAIGGTAVTCGEFIGYRHSLDLFGQQNQLVDAILATKIPTIVCLVNGGPLTINTIDQHADAILETWYLGEQAGIALAKTLFGEVNPSGKLTLSFPRAVEHLPVYCSKKSTAIHDYLAEETTPLYPFGYELSYAEFEYSKLTINKNEIKENEQFVISFDLKNTGRYEGEEIVQLYVRDVVSSVIRPIKELKGFKKVNLKSGKSKTIEFKLSTDDLKFYNQNMEYVVEPGEIEIMIGASSEDIKLKGLITVSNSSN